MKLSIFVLVIGFFCAAKAEKGPRDRIIMVHEHGGSYAGFRSGVVVKKRLRKEAKRVLFNDGASDDQVVAAGTAMMMVNGGCTHEIPSNWCSIISNKGSDAFRAWNNLGVEYMIKMHECADEQRRKSYVLWAGR